MPNAILTRLKVQNFRAIGPAPLDLELAPLTILVGENGAGKTSFLQALALTAQSALDDPRRSDLLLDGTKVELGVAEGSDYRSTYREVYFAKDADRPLEVEVECALDPSDPRAGAFKPLSPKLPKLGFKRWPPTRVSYRWSRVGIEWPVFSHQFSADGRPLFSLSSTFEVTGRNSGSQHTTWEVGSNSDPMNRGKTSFRSPDRVLDEAFAQLSVEGIIPVPGERVYGHLGDVIGPVKAITLIVRELLAKVALVEPLRGRKLAHLDVGPDVSFVGSHGEMVVRFLNLIQNRASRQFDGLRAWAERFGLPGIETGWGGGNQLKVAFRDPVTQVTLDLREAATGSYQGVLMAAQLLLSPPGSVVLWEEPESNLHPRFEKLLPKLFADAISSGHQVILSTHSEVLVAAVGNAVRSGALTPEQVAVWEFSRNADGVSASRIQVSKRGYLEGWVRSFASVERELFDEFAAGLPEEPKGKEHGDRHTRARGTRTGEKKRSRYAAKGSH